MTPKKPHHARLRLKKGINAAAFDTGSLCLGYTVIDLVFNMGPFPGGGDCILVIADGEPNYVNSNDLIHDMEAYDIEVP